MNIKLPMHYYDIKQIYAVVKDDNEYFIAVISITQHPINPLEAVRTDRSKSLLNCFNYTVGNKLHCSLNFNPNYYEYEIILHDLRGKYDVIMHDTTYEKLLIKCKELIPEEFL